jgi:hypothetical protein
MHAAHWLLQGPLGLTSSLRHAQSRQRENDPHFALLHEYLWLKPQGQAGFIILGTAPYNGLAAEQTMEQNQEQLSTEPRSASEHEPMLFCPVCSRRLAERKCKLYCEQCGYYMSCADYY